MSNIRPVIASVAVAALAACPILLLAESTPTKPQVKTTSYTSRTPGTSSFTSSRTVDRAAVASKFGRTNPATAIAVTAAALQFPGQTTSLLNLATTDAPDATPAEPAAAANTEPATVTTAAAQNAIAAVGEAAQAIEPRSETKAPEVATAESAAPLSIVPMPILATPATLPTAVAPSTLPTSEVANNNRPVIRAEDLPLTRPSSVPLDGSAEAGIDERTRFVAPPRPDVPQPTKPPQSTPENVDTGRGFLDWQRATDDWGGVRPKLEDRGISLNAQLVADWSGAVSGGANPRNSAYRQLLNANVTIDTERLFGHKGGTFFAQFQHHVGRNGSDVVGDAQAFSNIDADGRTQISEVHYQQKLWDDKLRAKIGKIDANADFATTPHAAEFINSSFGLSPTILLPTYPDTAVGALVFVQPNDSFYVGAGLFDGSAAYGTTTGENSPVSFLGSPSGVFVIAEAGVMWKAGANNLAGRAALGGWRHTADFETFGGRTKSGIGGFYVLAEQQLYKVDPAKEEDLRGLGAFVVFGKTDGDVNSIEWHLGGGIAWTGPFEGRDDDVVGLGATYVGFGKDPEATESGELALELFYKWQATKFFSIKPDLQYIVNPGGVRGRDNAFVATIRATLTF